MHILINDKDFHLHKWISNACCSILPGEAKIEK